MDPNNPDATLPEGVSEEEHSEQQDKSTERLPSLVDKRQALIDSIAKGVEEANRADMAEFDGEKLIEQGAAEGKEQLPASGTPSESAPAKKEEIPAAASQQSGDEPKEKLVIDGQEQEVPLSKILDAGKRALQKNLAADKRLEEATKLLRRAEEVASQVPPGKGTQTADPPKSDADKTQLRELLKAIRYGSDEEAEVAFEKAVGGAGSAKGPDVDEILTTVETRLAAKTILSQFSAAPEQGGFADIDGDEDLKMLAARKVDELIRAGKSPLDWSTYEEAGNYVRGKFGKPTASTPPGNGLHQKAARKTGIDNVQSAGGRVPKTPTPDDDQPKSVSDVIRDMKRSRVGQG